MPLETSNFQGTREAIHFATIALFSGFGWWIGVGGSLG